MPTKTAPTPAGAAVADTDLAVIARLDAAIRARRGADPDSSHTARLFAKGPLKCAQKFGEEAVEAVIAASVDDREELKLESADALYHLMVMLASRGLSLADVARVLEAREGVSGIAEKASRKKT
ncbi:phosphoribosyl-ATP pyrophosphatase [Albimonas donghaensis]|uniref:Phosphoribosyl-ATP pyrophosphatase n=1 Tax=Albimonas donghaensis TaxID=356660 RepID=A0A1H2XE20_9RHOB|nr:phosphoribosyl-ATP pyrophosphatase [Albimonas donghaensis]